MSAINTANRYLEKITPPDWLFYAGGTVAGALAVLWALVGWDAALMEHPRVAIGFLGWLVVSFGYRLFRSHL